LPAGGVPCTATKAEETAAAAPEPVPAEPDETPVPEAAATDPEPAAVTEPAAPESGDAPDLGVEVLPPVEQGLAEPVTGADDAAGEASATPSWWWLAGGLLLLAGGLAVHRLRRNTSGIPAAPIETDSGAADEALPTGPGSADGPQPVQPEPQLDSRLVLRGLYAGGRSFEIDAPVSAEAINLEIGRGGADLVLDSEAVSRRHARLNGSRSALTIADLGSRNGTSIDGVPCLEGEIMYLEPDCTVVLGDVRFTVSIEPEPGPP
jgi:hypothetical protein